MAKQSELAALGDWVCNLVSNLESWKDVFGLYPVNDITWMGDMRRMVDHDAAVRKYTQQLNSLAAAMNEQKPALKMLAERVDRTVEFAGEHSTCICSLAAWLTLGAFAHRMEAASDPSSFVGLMEASARPLVEIDADKILQSWPEVCGHMVPWFSEKVTEPLSKLRALVQVEIREAGKSTNQRTSIYDLPFEAWKKWKSENPSGKYPGFCKLWNKELKDTSKHLDPKKFRAFVSKTTGERRQKRRPKDSAN